MSSCFCNTFINSLSFSFIFFFFWHRSSFTSSLFRKSKVMNANPFRDFDFKRESYFADCLLYMYIKSEAYGNINIFLDAKNKRIKFYNLIYARIYNNNNHLMFDDVIRIVPDGIIFGHFQCLNFYCWSPLFWCFFFFVSCFYFVSLLFQQTTTINENIEHWLWLLITATTVSESLNSKFCRIPDSRWIISLWKIAHGIIF